VRQVRVSLGLQTDKEPGAYAGLAGLAEELGFDGVSVFSDLLYQPPIAALLEMAAVTSRIRLGCACWNPYTLHPYEIAGQFAAVDAASAGRAYLGLAKGSWLEAIGLEAPKPIAHLRDAIGVVQTLLAGEGRGYAGAAFRVEPGERLRYPVERPRAPILIGSWGPLGMALAGEFSDEIKVGGSANPAMVGVVRKRLQRGLDRAGRTSDAVDVVLGAVTRAGKSRCTWMWWPRWIRRSTCRPTSCPRSVRASPTATTRVRAGSSREMCSTCSRSRAPRMTSPRTRSG